MKTSQIFVISMLVISSTFLAILSLFELPQSMMEWVISDIILGTIFYLSYLIITLTFGSSKNKIDYRGKKITV